jgi:deoxyribodipyrimidine photo-lyase
MEEHICIFWFRRDLRLEDNAGLYHALMSGYPVLPVFIFDTNILDDLEEKADKRVDFIHQALLGLQHEIETFGSSIHVLHGTPMDCFKMLTAQYAVKSVYTNNDYEPYARQRDAEISSCLSDHGISFHSFKDHVIFEKDDVVKPTGGIYTVFTPYSRRWKNLYYESDIKPYRLSNKQHFLKQSPIPVPSLEELGFSKTDVRFSPPKLDEQTARNYHDTRNLPYLSDGTTRLSVHLRFGTFGIRQLAGQVMQLNEVLLNELIWREFFQMLLWHMPHTVSEACKTEYDRIHWRNNEDEFVRWSEGTTGYPIVDAGMRELNATGFMHNRVRMITASFLIKHLLIDWRWGEAYFAKKLLDYELASNIGNWQWAAGSGCDAAPYFRIFNPYTQASKFDPDSIYIKRWVPEIGTGDYPEPIVDHAYARERCLATYKRALRKDS